LRRPTLVRTVAAQIDSYVEKQNTVTRWTDIDHGGHFAAMEEPDALTADIRQFFRACRS
jgi:epoxide hydrolase